MVQPTDEPGRLTDVTFKARKAKLAPLHQAIFDTNPLTEEALQELIDLQEYLAKYVAPRGN